MFLQFELSVTCKKKIGVIIIHSMKPESIFLEIIIQFITSIFPELILSLNFSKNHTSH